MTYKKWINAIIANLKPEYINYNEKDKNKLVEKLIGNTALLPIEVQNEIKDLVFKRNKTKRQYYYILDEISYYLFKSERTLENANEFDLLFKKVIEASTSLFADTLLIEKFRKSIKDINDYLIDYYPDLLLMQYQKPKARAEIAALVSTFTKFSNLEVLRNAFNLQFARFARIAEIGEALGIPQDSGQFMNFEEWVFGVKSLKAKTYKPFVRGLRSLKHRFSSPPTKMIRLGYFKDKTAILPQEEYRTLIQFLLAYYSRKPNLKYILSVFWQFFRRGVVLKEKDNEFLIIIINEKDLVLSALKFGNLIVPFIGQKITMININDYEKKDEILKEIKEAL